MKTLNLFAAIIEFGLLGQVILYSLILCSLFTACFSSAVWGWARAEEARGQTLIRGLFLLFSGLSSFVCGAIVVLGIWEMIQ
jgi:hypothetical protein